jgi:cbb3-type cytochrome oxidase subunit 1
MDIYTRAFIRSSLVWLGIGLLIGLSMAMWPGSHLVYIPAHTHANLLGFLSMMVFGVAYHILPRFSGRPLVSPALARAHVWIANIGLALQVGGFLIRPQWRVPGMIGVAVGGTLSAIGGFCFIYNIWRTVGSADQAFTSLARK